jgi:benzoyl-CoA 2,3-dioxygenase component B
MSIDYSQKIPNNVNLADDRTLQRALEQWQPNFIRLVGRRRPRRLDRLRGLPAHRGPASIRRAGPHFDYVKMRDYRWGIFLNPATRTARSTSATQGREGLAGRARRAPREPAPHHRHAGRHRAGLGRAAAPPRPAPRRACTTCATCSRSTSRKAATCGRWSTCCRSFFGRDGREEAGALLERTSATRTTRASSALQREDADWLAFFMFTYFTDRDGKFQLARWPRARSIPLARTTKFMLTEEAHHMFVGESGVSRVLQRTCAGDERLKTDDPERVREAGAIDLPTIQRYLNFHYSVTIDLFGADQSSNAATSTARA